MATTAQVLTEKEKQTLRLLLGGHDAKSMARHLGLSVHTVNERLRDARRKLGVSSSREAARALSELERAGPHFSGDERLGDALPIPAMEHPGHPAGHLRAGLIIGGIAMSLALALLALTELAGSGTGSAPAQAPAQAAAESATIAAAKDWLGLLDKGDWNASWDATGQSFKSLNTSAKWSEVSQRVRAPLGAMRSREVATVDFAPAPPYGYWIVKFRTSYANRAEAIETVSLAHEDGAWRVVGVTID